MRIKRLVRNPLFILGLLCLFFIVPMFGAWFFWKEPNRLATHTTNRGKLIQPATNINTLIFSTQDHKILKFANLNGRWVLLYVIPTSCNQQCQKMIYLMRQIQTATGKNQRRIQRMVLVLDTPLSDLSLQNLNTQYPNMIIGQGSKETWQKIAPHLDSTPLAISEGYLYLVDPKGFMVLGYPLNENPSNVLKDLEKLLKASQIG